MLLHSKESSALKKKKWKFKRILVYLKYQLLFSKHFSKFPSLDCLLLIGHAKISSSYKEGYLHRIFLEKKLTAILSKSKNFTIFKETPLYVHTYTHKGMQENSWFYQGALCLQILMLGQILGGGLSQ